MKSLYTTPLAASRPLVVEGREFASLEALFLQATGEPYRRADDPSWL